MQNALFKNKKMVDKYWLLASLFWNSPYDPHLWTTKKPCIYGNSLSVWRLTLIDWLELSISLITQEIHCRHMRSYLFICKILYSLIFLMSLLLMCVSWCKINFIYLFVRENCLFFSLTSSKCECDNSIAYLPQSVLELVCMMNNLFIWDGTLASIVFRKEP